MSALAVQDAGTLEETPFSRLLVQLADRCSTGTLLLEEPSGARHGVYFEGGSVVKAKLAPSPVHLGEVLVHFGEISAELARSTLERALEEHVLHGQLLVAERLITQEALIRALEEQLSRQVAWLFGQSGATRFGYFEGANFLSHWGATAPLRKSTLELLWRGVRDHARSLEIEEVVATVAGRRMELRPELPPDHFAFMGKDRDVVERLRDTPQRLFELLGSAGKSDEPTKQVVCFLVLARCVEVGVPSAPPLECPVSSVSVVAPKAARMPSFASEQEKSRSAPLEARRPSAFRWFSRSRS